MMRGVFAARSLTGYASDEEKCKREMIKDFDIDLKKNKIQKVVFQFLSLGI